jgi:hypothetical protein
MGLVLNLGFFDPRIRGVFHGSELLGDLQRMEKLQIVHIKGEIIHA